MKGLCECGCGQKTWISTHNNATVGHVKGEPVRFLHGHSRRRPLMERLLEKIVMGNNECWQWIGSLSTSGYGLIGLGNGKMGGAHRVTYEYFVGPIPEGLQLDHLCRNRACANPAHLEPVTNAENVRRGYAARRLVT